MTKSIPTQEYLREAFSYVDGKLIWKIRPLHHFVNEASMNTFNVRFAGIAAGFRNSSTGYTHIMIDKKNFRLHQLVYIYHTGTLPSMIDHKNGDRDDSRIENLRPCTRAENNRNHTKKVGTKSKTGHLNVHPRPNGKFQVLICKDMKDICIGTFPCLESAVAAAAKARKKLFGEFA